MRYTDENKTNLFQHYGQIVIPYPKAHQRSALRLQRQPRLPDYQGHDAVRVGGHRLPLAGIQPAHLHAGQLVEVPGEKGTNYEIGSKTDFLDHRLRVNSALFYFDYSSHLTQVTCDAVQPGDRTRTQVRHTSSMVEFALRVRLWRVRAASRPGSSTRRHPRSSAARNCSSWRTRSSTCRPISRLATTTWHAHGVNPSVKTQPEINMSGGVQYAVPFSFGSVTPRLDWYYQSFMTNGPTTLHQIHPDFIVPGYSLFNARLTYTPVKGKWQLAFAGTNIFNHFYWQQLGAATPALRWRH